MAELHSTYRRVGRRAAMRSRGRTRSARSSSSWCRPRASSALLVGGDFIDLGLRMRTRVEGVLQELARQAPRQLGADDPRSEAQHLALLERTSRSTEYESCAVHARMPLTLLAEMAIPIPVPHRKIPKSASPATIMRAAFTATCG